MINNKINQKEVKMQQHIDKLVEGKVLAIGQKAKNNPETLDYPAFCLGIANKDYPAMTPALWNQTYKALGLTNRNIRLFGDPANIVQILDAFKADSRYLGGDIGVGFKDKAPQLLDELDPLAREMQAVNVVVKLPDGRLKGYNTDGLGFAISLEQAMTHHKKLIAGGDGIAHAEIVKVPGSLKGKKIVILGAGGTSNAIAFSLAEKGAELVILNRTVAKAEILGKRLNQYFGREIAKFGGRDQVKPEVKDAAAIVSVIDDPSMPLDKYSALGTINLPETPENISANLAEAQQILASLPKGVIISDVMLRQEDTATIREAKKAGLSTLDGQPMVLYQAIEAFWLVNQSALKAKGITKEKIAQIMIKAAKS